MAKSTHTYENSSSFFRNTACQYFPCHEGVEPDEFNCLFCYCPLYALGPHCQGNFSYNEKGVKDCGQCTMLHKGDAGVAIVKKRFGLLVDLARESCDTADADAADAVDADAGAVDAAGADADDTASADNTASPNDSYSDKDQGDA